MLMIILMWIIFFSVLFLESINPLTLGLTLIFQTLAAALLMGVMTKTFWILYLLILTFIGGMLVLFIYVTSIFPNEKFLFNQSFSIMFTLFLTITFIMLKIYTSYFNITMNMYDQKFYLPSINQSIIFSTKMFFTSTSFILIFLVSYLFFCMIVVIKIINFHQGPLRKMSYV